jgi:methionine sulfoxide reductase heme-binding subunit
MTGSFPALTPDRLVRLGKPLVFALCLLPLALLVAGAVTNDLGANPTEAITHTTGDWTLRLLLVTLAMTPLKHLVGQPWPIRFRRMLGLFAFFYACLHLLTYAWIDQGLDWQGIVEDVIKRPYVTVGFAAFVLLVPLALTSTRAMMRRLGRRWQTLHRAIYAIGILGVLHYLWLVKADLREPLIYAGILAALLLARLPLARLGVARRWPRIPSAEPQRDRG